MGGVDLRLASDPVGDTVLLLGRRRDAPISRARGARLLVNGDNETVGCVVEGTVA